MLGDFDLRLYYKNDFIDSFVGITSIDMMDKRSRERRSDFSDYESSTPRLFPRFVSRS